MTHPLRVLTVDDELLALRRLELLLRRMPEVELVGAAQTGHEALSRIDALRPDVVLLDIRMAGMDGLDIAAALLEIQDAPLVIFVTAFDEFAVRAFELSALDYVVKPVEFGRLRQAIVRAAERIQALDAQSQSAELRQIVAALRAERPSRSDPQRELWVQRQGQFIRVQLDHIEWAEAERDYVRLHAGPDSYLVRHTLAALQARLQEASFVRIRRSAIVRADRIKSIRKVGYGDVRVRLESGQELRVGRTYLSQVRKMVSPLWQASPSPGSS